MKDCADCQAGLRAMEDLREAQEYSARRFINDGHQSYDHDEAIRLGQRAAALSAAAPNDHCHSEWYVSDCDDFAMMQVEPEAFCLIKESRSDNASKDGMITHAPLELWADHIRWWE